LRRTVGEGIVEAYVVSVIGVKTKYRQRYLSSLRIHIASASEIIGRVGGANWSRDRAWDWRDGKLDSVERINVSDTQRKDIYKRRDAWLLTDDTDGWRLIGLGVMWENEQH
jgi:hypothetical protein